jgi:hypothetical protein
MDETNNLASQLARKIRLLRATSGLKSLLHATRFSAVKILVGEHFRMSMNRYLQITESRYRKISGFFADDIASKIASTNLK